jgi:small-conductance mechanosensitive channel
MQPVTNWIWTHWQDLAIAGSVAIAAFVVLLTMRRLLGRWLGRLEHSPAWKGLAPILRAVERRSLTWAALLSAYPAVQLLPIPDGARQVAARIVLSGLVLSVGTSAIMFVHKVADHVGERFGMPAPALRVASGVLAGATGLLTVVGLFDIWDLLGLPILLVLVLAAVLAAVALRDLLPAAVASFQMTAFRPVKVRDYIKLDSGLEGTVEGISWREIIIRAVDGSQAKIPLPKFVRATVVNQGPAVTRARVPLRFQQRSHIRELTRLKASNLRELAACLREAADSSLYYHTHQYLEEHQYLARTAPNAFSEWVSSALGNERVAEALAAVDVLQVATLGAVRERLVAICTEAVERGEDTRIAQPGQELYFLQSVTFITPCPFAAGDLRELSGVIRRVSLGSLYYHLFEARLLGGADALFDLSTWLRRQLDESALASEIERLDPYDYTFEGLKAALIARIEARLA